MVVTSFHLDVLLFRSIFASEPGLGFDISSTFKILKVISCGPVSLTGKSAVAIIHIESTQIGWYHAETFSATCAKSKSASIEPIQVHDSLPTL